MRVLKILALILFLFCVLKTGREVKSFIRLEGQLLGDTFSNGYKENSFLFAILGLQIIGVLAAIKHRYRFNYIMLMVLALLSCIVLAATLTLDSIFQIQSLPNVLFILVAIIYAAIYVKKYNVI
ncbi:hypothetical protein FFF34_000070 [Inquilinus sp. KBS0705]|nr:hypothetical protein FFF34_000070 [Inquilinus sp. KBS0705]